MSEFNKDILNYKIIHGRYCIQYCLDYIKSNNIKIDPNILIYTIIDKNSKNQLMLNKINITNNSIKIIEISKYIKWESKIKESIVYIKNNYNDIPEFILYIDGFDVMILNDIVDPKSILEYYNCKILFNGEANDLHTGFPEPTHNYFDKLYYDEAKKYVELNTSKYNAPLHKRLNAGVFLGYKYNVLEMLEETYEYMMDDFNKGFPYGCKDDQCLLRYIHNKHYDIISVDVFNKYFIHCTHLSNSIDVQDNHHYQFFDRYKQLYKNA
jgi:hypothetical protein